MFTKNNRQLQSTAKAEINNDNQNNRKASVFINKLFARGRAFLFVVAVAFSFFAMSADSAQAQQQNNYWATDGCFYSHNGSQWRRMCPTDQSRTKYFFDMTVNNQWLRFAFVDNTLYSDNGRTFRQTYHYAQQTWVRTYSNVGRVRQPNPMDAMRQTAADAANAPWLRPACSGSSNGCGY